MHPLGENADNGGGYTYVRPVNICKSNQLTYLVHCQESLKNWAQLDYLQNACLPVAFPHSVSFLNTWLLQDGQISRMVLRAPSGSIPENNLEACLI